MVTTRRRRPATTWTSVLVRRRPVPPAVAPGPSRIHRRAARASPSAAQATAAGTTRAVTCIVPIDWAEPGCHEAAASANMMPGSRSPAGGRARSRVPPDLPGPVGSRRPTRVRLDLANTRPSCHLSEPRAAPARRSRCTSFERLPSWAKPALTTTCGAGTPAPCRPFSHPARAGTRIAPPPARRGARTPLNHA